jgi:glycosyltransferase involved in cell wall biosynthesis
MKISVVIPLFNKKDTIRKTLESVLNQTSLPEEVIVVNDGSTDGSEIVVESLKLPFVRLINQVNAGVSFARNKGIEEAMGDWIAFLDADDLWFPEYLENIKYLSEEFPKCNVLATSYVIKYHNGFQKRISLNKLSFQGRKGKLHNYFELAAASHPPIWTSATVVNKESLMTIGGFPNGIILGEDLITWAKLAVKFEIAYINEPLSVFVQDDYPNSKSLIRIPDVPDVVGNELINLAGKNSEITAIRKYISLWFKMRSSIFLRLGMRKEAFLESIKSLKYNLLNLKVYFYFLCLPFPASLIRTFFKRFETR